MPRIYEDQTVTGLLKRFRKGDTAQGEIAPARPFYAIGDVHGCPGLLQEALEKIDDDIERHKPDNPAVVLLGDYIDRGPQSAEVLQMLFQTHQAEPEAFVCLMGNHEAMLLDFFDAPQKAGDIWLHHGGRQTLKSFEIDDPGAAPDAETLVLTCECLLDALPDGMEHWLRELPFSWSSGNLHCTHAGMDPGRSPDDQDPKDLLWGHRDFLGTPRTDSAWIVHGHWISDAPGPEAGRIAMDTGAYQTGRLTTAAFTDGSCRLL